MLERRIPERVNRNIVLVTLWECIALESNQEVLFLHLVTARRQCENTMMLRWLFHCQAVRNRGIWLPHRSTAIN